MESLKSFQYHDGECRIILGAGTAMSESFPPSSQLFPFLVLSLEGRQCEDHEPCVQGGEDDAQEREGALRFRTRALASELLQMPFPKESLPHKVC